MLAGVAFMVLILFIFNEKETIYRLFRNNSGNDGGGYPSKKHHQAVSREPKIKLPIFKNRGRIALT